MGRLPAGAGPVDSSPAFRPVNVTSLHQYAHGLGAFAPALTWAPVRRFVAEYDTYTRTEPGLAAGGCSPGAGGMVMTTCPTSSQVVLATAELVPHADVSPSATARASPRASHFDRRTLVVSAAGLLP